MYIEKWNLSMESERSEMRHKAQNPLSHGKVLCSTISESDRNAHLIIISYRILALPAARSNPRTRNRVEARVFVYRFARIPPNRIYIHLRNWKEARVGASKKPYVLLLFLPGFCCWRCWRQRRGRRRRRWQCVFASLRFVLFLLWLYVLYFYFVFSPPLMLPLLSSSFLPVIRFVCSVPFLFSISL